MSEKVSDDISLDELVRRADFIAVVSWNGNTHSAFPPKNPLDGAMITPREVLWSDPKVKPLSERVGWMTRYPVARPAIYRSSIPLDKLFAANSQGTIDPVILFFAYDPEAKSLGHSFQIACTGAWESIEKINTVKEAIRRVKR